MDQLKMPLGTVVGLGTADIVLDGIFDLDPSSRLAQKMHLLT